jgi:hypothetical protein
MRPSARLASLEAARCAVPTDRSALDNATLLPACRNPPLTCVLYFGCHRHFGRSLSPVRAPGVDPQAVRVLLPPGGSSFASAGQKKARQVHSPGRVGRMPPGSVGQSVNDTSALALL